LRPDHAFLPDLETIPHDVLQRAKLLVLNYPNSPTGGVATREFYARVIDFAREHRIVVVQDAAHILLTFDGPPLSFLSIPGARDVGVEVHSLSKGFDMIGWRIGWVCGNAKIIQALADVKDNCDSGQFIAIQKAAITALDDPDIPQRINAKYRRRLQKLVATLAGCGFDCQMPGGSYFLYTRAPRGTASGMQFGTAEQASQYLIREHSMVTVPWEEAGPFLRFSVTYVAPDEPAEDALMAETQRRLRGDPLLF
jgi:LL-diaminopimelate aminotransferase